MDKKKILVVEDEKAISDILVFNLQREGYDTLAAYDGAEGLRCALEEAPDLILLDVMLPEMDGFEVCRRVRAEKDTPIIMLTAREEETDKVMGLELGADDYIIKPFRNLELLSRIKNVLRRNVNSTQINIGSLRIDTDTRKVYLENNEIPLTKLEFEILKIMAGNPRKVFTREEILSYIWDSAGNFVNDNTLTVTVKRLREKLGDKEGKLIVTVRGVGYKIGDMSK